MRAIAVCLLFAFLLFVSPVQAEDKIVKPLDPYKLRLGTVGKFPTGVCTIRAQTGSFYLMEFVVQGKKRKLNFLFEGTTDPITVGTEYQIPNLDFRVDRIEEYNGKKYKLVRDASKK